jgi:hypothetical protein
MHGRRQSSSRQSWQSNDREPREWNDGGLGGGPRERMSGDDSRFDRWENHSNEWETDQGRASYGDDPSRHFGSAMPYGREGSDRGDYGRGSGDRGGSAAQFGSQEESRGARDRYDSGSYRSGQYGEGSYEQGRYDMDRYRSRGDYGQGGQQFGPGEYGRGGAGQDYGRQHEYSQGGSFGAGIPNRGFGEGGSRGYSGRGPKGYQRSDERIREDVSDSLTDDPEVDASEITVEARDGEVTLTGTVQTREEKRAAEACVEGVSGVREVINQLRVSRGSSSGESSSGGASSGRSQSGQSGKGGRSSSES